MKRQKLIDDPYVEEIAVGKHYTTAALAIRELRGGFTAITMSISQPWDALLQAAYDGHAVILELDPSECVVKCYRKPRSTM